MTNHATLLRQIRAEARPYIEQWLEIGEVFAGFRKLAADNDLDWGVIKALIKAEVQDEQDEQGGSKRVAKIIDKADCASAYADMLGLGGGEEKINFSSEPDIGIPISLPPHDEDGVIIDLPPAEPVRPSADIQGSGPPAEENGPLLNDVPATGPATAPAPGAGSDTITAKGDAGENSAGSCDPANTSDASSTNSEIHREPSNRDVSADGEAYSAAASQGQAAQAGTGSETLASHEGDTQGEGASALSPINSGAPLTPDAPGTPGLDPVEAPGAPHSGEMPDLPAFLDRRSAA